MLHFSTNRPDNWKDDLFYVKSDKGLLLVFNV